MAKAHIVTADGATVNLEGTPQEIAALLKEMKVQPHTVPPKRKQVKSLSDSKISSKVTVGDLLDEMIADTFFKKPQGMGAVKTQLANMGHHFPITSLSGPLRTHVRRRKLRRFKESGKYVYAQ
ncbi:MAG: hypothetical protein WAL34_15110 [Acidobacteriaceae bacterium]|jgi:hypothetical protein